MKATFYNAIEYVEYMLGKRRLEDVRSVYVDALVDMGSTFPALPEDKIEELGLPLIGGIRQKPLRVLERLSWQLTLL